MKKKKIKRNLVALLSVVTLTVTGLHTDIMSAPIYAAQKNNKENIEAEKEISVVKELTEERTENSNTYLMSDGSKKLEILGENIRYKENGKLKDYNTCLSNINKNDKKRIRKALAENASEDFDYVNASGDSKHYFPDELKNGSEIVMSKDKYSLSFLPCIEKENILMSKVKDNEITYTSSNTEIEYQYTSLKNGVKENIIFNSRPETNAIKFILKNRHIYYELQESGEIGIYEEGTKKQVGKIVAPNIIDAEGNIDYTKVRYELKKDGDDIVLNIVIDKEYLEDKDTKYPLTVDPTAVWFGDKLPAAIVNSVTGRSDDIVLNNSLILENNYEYNEAKDKRSSKVYIDTTNLIGGTDWLVGTPEISGKYIENSYLYLGEQAASKEYVKVEVKSPESAWNVNTVTWSNQPEINDEVIATTWNKGEDGRNHGVNLTKWVQAIADGKKENHGLVLEAAEYGKQCSYYGTLKPGQNFMCIDIIYRDIEKYDTSVKLSAEYTQESGKIGAVIEDTNKLQAGVTTKGYKIYARQNDEARFSSIYQGDDVNQKVEMEIESGCNKIDYRVCVLYSDGTVKPSNIVSFEKQTKTLEGNGINENTAVSYKQTIFDTDGDGLEDGYEIWDFKTYWNTETQDSTAENPSYELDSDGDGFPDSYEVFVLGTDPAVANQDGNDSDGDGLTDIEEFHRGTDPHLTDSDFDGISDLNDYGSTNPRKTDNPNIKGTEQSIAYSSPIHIGLYEREYSEENNGVTYSYIKNIYRDKIKQVEIDYGNSSLNKTIKYFYNENGNYTAIIEQYDTEYDPLHEQTVCITYTYDKNNNIEFICDRETKYTMLYNNGKLKNFKIGEQEIVNYENIVSMDKTEQVNTLDFGDIIKCDTNEINYKNNQKIKTRTYRYKIQDNDFDSTAYLVYIYYNAASSPSYQIQYNIEGTILKLIDYTGGVSNPVTYNYTSSNGNTMVTRSDGFTKSVSKKEETDNDNKTHTTTTTTGYTYKDLKGATKTKSTSLVTKIDEDNHMSSELKMYDKDKFIYSADSNKRAVTERIYSTAKNEYILNMSQIIHNNLSTTRVARGTQTDENGDYMVDSLDYTYDLAGNITQIKENNELVHMYTYNPYGKITEETDIKNRRTYMYEYDTVGNVTKRTTYILNKVGELKEVEEFEYNNNEWYGQLTAYKEEQNKYEITYDKAGNPIHFIDGQVLSWNRGRLLEGISSDNESGVTYRYNENGYRTYKSVTDSNNAEGVTTIYEWDGKRLIKERNTNYITNKTYDIWYLYDDRDNIFGYDYVYVDTNNTIKSSRAYYEKDIQGSVIGLWNENGYKVASYDYDSWGNLVKSTCSSEWKNLCAVNHIGYKGYYIDDESGFYYLGQGYYVPKLGRSLNLDEVIKIVEEEKCIANNYLSYKDFIYPTAYTALLPTDKTGYDVDYEVDEDVEYCDTKSLIFESMNNYNTNCYGFAINCWTYKGDDDYRSNIEPGMFNSNVNYNNVYIPCTDIATYVKQDIEYCGKDAVILTGSNNNPYYETDEKHCLIAVRTMSEYDFYHSRNIDYFHFMLRKDDGWYFKSGWKVGIFKLRGNNNPNTVNWVQYAYSESQKKCISLNNVTYNSQIQYMVVSKMQLQIK